MSVRFAADRPHMTERMYLFAVGAYMLMALYMDSHYLVYGLAAFLAVEGITGIRLTSLVQKTRNVSLGSGLVIFDNRARFNVDGLSVWRVIVAVVLVSNYALLHEYGYEVLWFIPWFLAFAIIGAGASGICPVLVGLRWAGFK